MYPKSVGLLDVNFHAPNRPAPAHCFLADEQIQHVTASWREKRHEMPLWISSGDCRRSAPCGGYLCADILP